MNDPCSIISIKKQAFIVVKNGVVTEVSNSFTDITEYMIEDFQNCNIEEVFKTLLVGPDIDIYNIDGKADYFLFTKSLDARFVSIEFFQHLNKVVYTFTEKPNSRLDVKFPFVDALCSDNYCGVAIYSLPDLTLLKANETYINFFEPPYNKLEGCFGKCVKEYVAGFEGSSSEQAWKTLLATGKTHKLDDCMFDRFERGITYWRFTLTPIYENNILKYCVEMTTDITSQVTYRKKMEEQAEIIKQQKRELEVILDNMADGFSIIGKDGNFINHNKTARKWFANTDINKVEDILNPYKCFDINGKELDESELPAAQVLRGENIENFNVLVKRDQVEKYLSISGKPIYDEKDNVIWGVLNSRDITELIKNQREIEFKTQQLIKAEKDKSEALENTIEMKDEFLSLISHELRTPLSVINTAIQALEIMCKDELSDRAIGYIKAIKQNMFRQLRLVNNLLDITRADAGRTKVYKKNIDLVLLTKLIIESVHTYASQKGVKLTFLSLLEKKVLAIDDEKYERILLNLLSNAIKFTPAGKAITVKIRSVKKNVCIEVIDNGIGIPEDKLQVIFEKFGQVDSSLSRQAEGAGIGLSLVKRYVEALGGNISVKSKVGKGSTFIMMLPQEKLNDESFDKPTIDLMDSRLVQVTNVEFSDIYL